MRSWRSLGRGLLRGAAAAGVALVCTAVWAEPALNGQTGLIYMPDGRIEADGTFRLGVSYADPYLSGWASLSIFPFLELSGAYTRTEGVVGIPGTEFGDFKDKSADLKLRVLKEGKYWPSLSLGAQDFFGTQVYGAEYVALSKRLGDFDFTLGYGRDRIDGVFGGVRYSPSFLSNLSLVAEYDANDYAQDFGSDITGVDERNKGPVVGLEYKWKWLGAQLSYGHDEVGVNAYVSVPLNQREYVPKIKEPPPYTKITPRPTLTQWESDPTYRQRMVRALLGENFKAVQVRVQGTTVRAQLTNTRISQVSRAVGRAARIILLTSPLETREIRIVYTVADLPFATYTFSDVGKLQRYFNGMIPRSQLADTVSIRYATPSDTLRNDDKHAMLDAFDEPYRVQVLDDTEGDFVSFRSEGAGIGGFKVSPKISFFFNDPSGALAYDIYLLGSYRRELWRRLFFDGALRLTLLENVSDTTTVSNSQLPHVRSDLPEYLREGNTLRMERLLLNQFFFPATRVYARASVGYYEMMYGGVGGQVLYLPQSGKWGFDVSLDWVKQRDFQGGFGFQDYSTVTSIASLHVKLPYLPETTGTVRIGRFLAKDEGARFELKRRFNSGIEVGVWYTRTNGDDITSPGAPGDPYYDKGIFVSIPLSPMLLKDSQAKADISLSPWTRDVGQMVTSPADLYDMFERPVRDVREGGGMQRLGDYDDVN